MNLNRGLIGTSLAGVGVTAACLVSQLNVEYPTNLVKYCAGPCNTLQIGKIRRMRRVIRRGFGTGRPDPQARYAMADSPRYPW